MAAQVRSLRANGATYDEIKKALNIGSDTVSRMLGAQGSVRRRPRIAEPVRAQARAFRHAGWSVPEIARELGLAKSTAWQITKDISWQPTPGRRERAERAARVRWERDKARRAVERERLLDEMADEVGQLSDRELLLLGVVLYWAEGSKRKPWNSMERMRFINSDPDVILLYLAWLRLIGVADERRSFRVHIHQSSDVRGAEQFWADLVGVPVDAFAKATLKRHNPKTRRHNTGETYRGCLAVDVLGSSGEYRRMEALWRGVGQALRQRAVGSK